MSHHGWRACYLPTDTDTDTVTTEAPQKAYQQMVGMLQAPTKRSAFALAHTPWLFDPGVVGLSYGHRRTDTGATAEPVLIVYVRNKASVPPGAANAIPRQIKLPNRSLIGVDVREQPIASASAPPHGSVRVSNGNTFGRIATWVRKGQREYLLTCAHVLKGNSLTIETLAQTWVSVGTSTLLATLSADPAVVQTNADQGLIRPTQTEVATGVRWPRHTRLSNVELAVNTALIINHGRQSDARARVLQPRTTQAVDIGGRTFLFADLIKTTLASRKGDSGSSVVDEHGGLVGYVIADTSDARGSAGFTLIQPIRPVLRSLRCSLSPASSDTGYVVALLSANVLAHATSPEQLASSLDPDPKEVDVLARTLWGEVREESAEVMDGLAHLIRNRLFLAHIEPQPSARRFGSDVATICRKRRDFPCWSNGKVLREVNESDPNFRRALAVAHAALSGRIGPDPTLGATYQKRLGHDHRHAAVTDDVVVIGSRQFYQTPS